MTLKLIYCCLFCDRWSAIKLILRGDIGGVRKKVSGGKKKNKTKQLAI